MMHFRHFSVFLIDIFHFWQYSWSEGKDHTYADKTTYNPLLYDTNHWDF
ncbi:hypothetical protein [uncultured Sphaerochaeta sp.]|nr:hypothetical protein [uncultured Sphaerochaeta sp.]